MILINGHNNVPNIPHREKKKAEQQQIINKNARFNIKKLDKYMVLKNGTTKQDLTSFLTRFDNCSNNEIIASYKSSTNNKLIFKKIMSNACNEVRFCKICANRKTAERYNRLKPHLKELQKLYKNVYLMTFTQKTNSDLYTAIETMQQNFRKWYRLAEHNRSGEYGKIKAGIKSLEVVKGKSSNEWHVHIHFLAFSGERIDYQRWNNDLFKTPKNTPIKINGIETIMSKLQREWYEATGNTIVDCKPITRNKRYSKNRDLIEGAVKEVLKYNTKITDYSSEDLAMIYDATRGVRHFEPMGLLRNMDKSSLENEKRLKEELINFKKQIQNDKKIAENYRKRVMKTTFSQLKYDNYNQKIKIFDITSITSYKRIAYFPEAVEILQRVQGAIVAEYNKKCNELKKQIGIIPNFCFVAAKNKYRDNMKKSMNRNYYLINKIVKKAFEKMIDDRHYKNIFDISIEYNKLLLQL